MASAASPSTPSGAVGASMWAGQPPSKSGWGRGGESGSAFRETNRGGRPGRGGGGRGGRGGRGGARQNNSNTPRTDDKASKPSGTQIKETPKSTASAQPSIPAPAKDTKPRPPRKVSEAKAPRKLPPIVIEPPTVAATDSPVSATTPNRSRRKRSTNRSTLSISSKKSPSTESSTDHLRPDKSPLISKDLPPHLAPPPPPETPSFDIKHDINALVERVRAVAMERPNTPGSHIDWAGDEDDSLPDLDDWGVKSVTNSTSNTSVDQPDLISPILADALKPLPSIEFGSPFIVPSAVPPQETPQKSSPVLASSAHRDGDDTPRGAVTDSQPKGKPADKPQSAATAATKDTAAKKSPLKQSHFPLHPSLPAKPVDAIGALSKRPPKKENPPHVHTPDHVADVELPSKSEIFQATHVSQPNGVAPQEQPSESSPSPDPESIAPSMHASVHSAPSHITTHTTPTSTSFQPTHGRAHTLGRPGGVRGPPFSPPNGLFSDERASRRDRVNHARTHSTPPIGPGGHARHGSRPVITGDALSRLARTLGAPPKREAASVAAAAKD
ncbi:hypothetical protein OH76DRAFT_764629 [Lentinus brumalis]|uniref:Uncharacterized protein n=1 Tax=Lentinus brumalis TaxID=2498619 RepID=A0A371DTA5_9APHY|nr:hypothetical protein OH76DRAFT_764629 [Polyporus brumalis]